MADPLIVIVFVAAGGAADATTGAMERATHDALGLEAHVEVYETEIVPSDLDALITEQRAHAAAVVELTWAEQRRQARLRVHVAQSGRWISRSIGFLPSDAEAERGRTIGFAVASMLPDALREESPPTPSPPLPPPPPETSAVAPSAPDTGSSAPTPSAVSASPTSPAPPDALSADRRPSAEKRRAALSLFALDLSGMATLGLDANAQSQGGRAAGHWFFADFASLRLGAGVDGGGIDAARGNALTALLSGGIALHAWRTAAARPFGLSLRAEYLLAHQAMTGFPSNGPSALTRSRWISGLELALDARWRLTSSVDLLVGTGLQQFFARTYIDRMGVRVASVPSVRCFGELGLGVRF